MRDGLLAGLSFGWRTAILLAAATQILIIAGALLRPIANRRANQTLSLLLVVLTGMLVPWMIGFAGFYDKWRWLTFAPFSVPLTIAPLAWFYVHALVTREWPRHWRRHLLLPAAQFGYLLACFLILRQPFKNDWLVMSGPAYGLLTAVLIAAGLIGYGGAALRLLGVYRAAIARQRSDDHRYAARWLSGAIGALVIVLGAWLGWSLTDLVYPLGYTGLMGLYVAIAVVALFLAVEGWRHAHRPFPPLEEPQESAEARDWSTLGAQWVDRLDAEGWFRDPELNVASLARLLGTNSSYVSRAFNEGMGENFSTIVNRMRCRAVAHAIDAGHEGDLLGLALDCGFSSKASFNRAFLAEMGMAPTAYRARLKNAQNA